MNNFNSRPCALIILDGWGIAPSSDSNAISIAHTPYYDEICKGFPSAALMASGAEVGLSVDSAGNPEAGHLNIGAGRVVRSDVARISAEIKTGDFFENKVLRAALRSAAERRRPVHLIGLISDGGVHSSSETLYAILRIAKREHIQNVFVHGILDGRDVAPRSADIFVEALEIKIDDIGVGKIATLCGRHFAMDSAEHWDRTARCYTMLVHAEGERASDAATAIRSSYLRGIDDEFIAPIVMETGSEVPVATIQDGDTVIFFNHRADTMRQLVRTLAVPDPFASRSAKPRLDVVCLVEYDKAFGLPVAFSPDMISTGLNAALTRFGIPNYRFAEPERSPHVTRFLNGGGESSNQFEKDVVVSGTKISVHESGPEMGSFKLADKVINAVETDGPGLYVANFSAADVVAETGDLSKTIESIQFIDTCLGGIYETIREESGVLMITSSHGRCEEIGDVTGAGFNRAGTHNPVPFHLVDFSNGSISLKKEGSLRDVAPTVLGMLGIGKLDGMTGNDLRKG